MPSFKTMSFRNNKTGKEYEVNLSLNDAAIINNNVEIEVTGRYRDQSEYRWVEDVFTVQLSLNRPDSINIIYRGNTIGTLNISYLEGAMKNGMNDILDRLDVFDEHYEKITEHAPDAWSHLQSVFREYGVHPFEEVIHHIPSDPVFGCLIKAGLSTAIGQLIKCYSESNVSRIERFRQKVYAMLHCLGINSLSMVGRFTFRTLRCALTHGLH